MRIIERRKYKAYGKGTGGYIKQRLCIVVAPDTEYKFDLSGQFPDFRNTAGLLSQLKEHTKIVEISQ